VSCIKNTANTNMFPVALFQDLWQATNLSSYLPTWTTLQNWWVKTFFFSPLNNMLLCWIRVFLFRQIFRKFFMGDALLTKTYYSKFIDFPSSGKISNSVLWFFFFFYSKTHLTTKVCQRLHWTLCSRSG